VLTEGNHEYYCHRTGGYHRRVSAAGGATRPFSITDVVGYAVGVAGLAACLTVLFLAMRAVMDIGGYCAEGGPYVIDQHCPEGVPLLLTGSVFGLFLFGGVMGWMGARIGGPYAGLVLLAWPVLFISLGWNFLQYAFDPPAPAEGIIWGWLIPGVIFVVMGAVPLLALLPERRSPTTDSAELRRTRSRLLNTMAARAEQRGWTVQASGTAAATQRAAGEDLVTQLERLARLRNDGSLTELQFEQAKRALLDARGGG
jgi:hypothetical protein